MSSLNLEKLVEWLGEEGAIAGLERSRLTNAELMVLARQDGHIVDKKTARKQIIIELIMSKFVRIEKSDEFLLGMSSEEIQRYFSDRLVSNREIGELLSRLGIAPTGKLRGKLADYAAREIGELGRFQRVARGAGSQKKG